MKKTDIKKLSLPELKEKLNVEKEVAKRLKFSHAISPIEDPSKIRKSRRQVARLLTEISIKDVSK